MTVVSSAVVKPDSTPLAGVKIEAALSWDIDISPVPRSEDDDFTFMGIKTAHSDNDGEWSMDLYPNENIEPPDSVYKITESKNDLSNIYYVSVPDNTGANWIGDLIVTAPSWED